MNIYDKKYNYTQLKFCCEIAKQKEKLEQITQSTWTYEDIIDHAIKYYNEWLKLVKKYPNCELNEEEYAYEQNYVARRLLEDYVY